MATPIKAIVEDFPIDPDGTVIVRMLLTDNSTFKKETEYRLKPYNNDDLKARVRNDAVAVKPPQDPASFLVKGGEFDYSLPPPIPPVDPTDEEIARNKFIKDLNTRRQMEQAIDLELKTKADQDYIDQVALVKSEFIDPDYLPYL